MSAIRQFEREQTEAMKPAIQQYEALLPHGMRSEGILSAIRDAGKKGKPTHKMREDLEQLQLSAGVPTCPRLLLEDETPENLVWSLAKQWPSSGIISSEAGMVLGSHAMGRDSVMRNLATLNIVWDGGVLHRKKNHGIIQDARRTRNNCLANTRSNLHNFLEKSGDLARGQAFSPFPCFVARIDPRFPHVHRSADALAHLSAFHARITAMLSQPFTLDEDGMLTPTDNVAIQRG